MQFHLPTNLPTPVLGSQWGTTTGAAAPGTPSVQQQGGGQQLGHVRVDSAREEVPPETEFEKAMGRNKGWLEKRKRSEVEELVALSNTDLRAGEDWLVYVSPAVKKRMGIKIW